MRTSLSNTPIAEKIENSIDYIFDFFPVVLLPVSIPMFILWGLVIFFEFVLYWLFIPRKTWKDMYY